MDTEAPVQAPTNIEGVAIHLSYLRKDIREITHKIDNISNSFATKEDMNVVDRNSDTRFKENRLMVEDHERRIRGLEIWKYGIISSIAVLSFLIANNLLHLIK